MSEELGPGVEVRCVDARPHGSTGEILLVVGRVYRISRVFGDELLLDQTPDHAWVAVRFEPIGRRSFDRFLTIGEPADDLAPA